ncbi:MAG: hypothetical protein ACI9WT_000348 [Flavobacterium sp.]|jgi:hypothetical protein
MLMKNELIEKFKLIPNKIIFQKYIKKFFYLN